MFIVEMFEDSGKRLVVTYPGRFQPFHKGHRDVFASLQSKFGGDNVFIVTSDKTDNNKSPFNFNDKVQFMHAAGVADHNIIEAGKVYDLPDQFKAQAQDTIFVTAVGEPDARRLNPGSTKKDGNPSYFQTFPENGDISQLETADKHGYVIIAHERPEVISVKGQQVDVSHGTPTRALWNSIRNDEKARGEFITQLYGRNDPELGRILDKIPQQVNEEAAGVGVVKNGNDPRYVMATTGDDNDVTAATLGQMMKSLHLTGKKKIAKEGKGLDSRLQQVRKFAQQHYSGLDAQDAFEKFVQRSLEHSKDDSVKQQAMIQDLNKRVTDLEHTEQPTPESGISHYRRDRFKSLDQREKDEEVILKQAMRNVQGVSETKGLAKQVKIVKGPDAGKTGRIREIKHGAFKGAPKSYYIDLDGGGQANNLPATALRLVKDVDVAEGSLEEYGDTAKGQKMLTKVQKRAVDRVVSKKADTDPKYAKKNSDTANRAWDRMTDKDVAEDEVHQIKENAEELNVGDEVIVTGPVEYKGSTGVITDFGNMKRFVVVDLYNHGKHSFHSSDISFNEYADSEEEDANWREREGVDSWDEENLKEAGYEFDESMYQYDKQDPFNSEFAPDVGMGRMTLRAWKQSLIRRAKQLAADLDAAGQHIDNAVLWDRVYAKMKSLNMDPIAQEIELAHKELEGIRRQGGARSRAFKQG